MDVQESSTVQPVAFELLCGSHISLIMQDWGSLQKLSLGVFEQPVVALQVSTVQPMPSEHTLLLGELMQEPLTQVSTVQRTPSSQEVGHPDPESGTVPSSRVLSVSVPSARFEPSVSVPESLRGSWPPPMLLVPQAANMVKSKVAGKQSVRMGES